MEIFDAPIKKDDAGRLTIVEIPFHAKERFGKSKGTINVSGTINGVAYRSRLLSRSGNYRISGYYAPDSDPAAEEYGYEVCVTIPEDMEVRDDLIRTKTLQGGLYLKQTVKYSVNGAAWYNFIQKLEESTEYGFGPQLFMEEYLIEGPVIDRETMVAQYMPVIKKV